MTEVLEAYGASLGDWFEQQARGFLVDYSPDRVEQLQADVARIGTLLGATRRELSICFLGNSGVGKSTFLNSLIEPAHAVLPQGGVGPLTAQAISVRWSKEPYFRVEYLSGRELNRLAFTLARYLETQERRNLAVGSEEIGTSLSEEERRGAELDLPANEAVGDPAAERSDRLRVDGMLKQTCLLVKGDQYAGADAAYLLQCLRFALASDPAGVVPPLPEDRDRLEGIREALATARSGTGPLHVRRTPETAAQFQKQLRDHASGYLAPLIATIELGWPADVLANDLVLVDLPGLGTRADSFRGITRERVRSARAVVLVVDRSGVSEASAELLRDTGFLHSMLHEVHDPDAEYPELLVAVVKLDLTADDERRSDKEQGRRPYPWVTYFDEACASAERLVREQIREELLRLAAEGSEATRDERLQVVGAVLSRLRVHPVSALEYRKLALKDDEDRAQIVDPLQSRIPRLSDDFRAIALDRRQRALDAFQTHVGALRQKLLTTLELIEARWESDGEVAGEAGHLAEEVDELLEPLKEELSARRASFREFLRETAPALIETAVLSAGEEARKDIARFLRRFRDYHWGTLRAAVRRGGTFLTGAKPVDLPNELTLRFEDPVAVAWSKEILPKTRKRTSDLGADYLQIQGEILVWARGRKLKLSDRVMGELQEQLKGDVDGFKRVGKDAIDELKTRVKEEFYSRVEKRIRRTCERFVESKKNEGPGVKRRILDFLDDDLTNAVLEAASPAAQALLMSSFKGVEEEINESLRRLPNPIMAARETILSRHEEQRQRADEKLRQRLSAGLALLRSTIPAAPEVLL